MLPPLARHTLAIRTVEGESEGEDKGLGGTLRGFGVTQKRVATEVAKQVLTQPPNGGCAHVQWWGQVGGAHTLMSKSQKGVRVKKELIIVNYYSLLSANRHPSPTPAYALLQPLPRAFRRLDNQNGPKMAFGGHAARAQPQSVR